MGKKTKLTGMTDHSSWGTELQSDMHVSVKSAKDIIKMFKNTPIVNDKGDRLVRRVFENESGSQWSLVVRRDGEEYVAATYAFETRGEKRIFLNVQGNPTILACGQNDIPILIKGYPGQKKNAVTTTFQYCNRFLFILLEMIPSNHPFQWEGEDRKRFERGDINIKQLQYAWYSADLGVDRDVVLNFVRRIYTGDDDMFGIVRPLADILNIRMEKWKDTTNTTLSVNYRNMRYQSLTLYKKDEHPEYDGENGERLSQIIRFDCTFYHPFLTANKINTVALLEETFVARCEADGYDTGFYRWLNERMSDRFKLGYLAKITPVIYMKMVRDCDRVESKPDKALAEWWLNMGEYTTNIDLAKATGLPEGHISEYIKNFRDRTNIDISIPRHYLIRMLWYRMTGKMTIEEIENYVKSSKRRSNNLIGFDELLKRETEDRKTVMKHLKGENVVKFRRLSPRKIRYADLWIRKVLQEYAA